ncbi:MAG: sugar ABC transporter permease [bacterium]|nr:sugar ABC transporter permease [bacterium]
MKLTRNSFFRQQLIGDCAFMLPATLLFTLFVVYPVLSSFYFSLTDWNGIAPEYTFIGLVNFRRLLTDKDVWLTLKNTLTYAVLVTSIQNSLGLLLALAVNQRIFQWVRVLFLIPALLSTVAIGNIWNYMYEPNIGAINSILSALHLSDLAQNWLGDPSLALYCLVATNVWQWVGVSMIIYLAGLQAVPLELEEAASIDGANALQRFRHITIPLLAPSFTVNIVLAMIGSVKVFDIIYIMTKGGPARSTESLTTLIFDRAFNFYEFGYGTAIGIMMFLLILVLSLIQLNVLLKREVKG